MEDLQGELALAVMSNKPAIVVDTKQVAVTSSLPLGGGSGTNSGIASEMRRGSGKGMAS